MWRWLCRSIINVNIIFEDCQSQCLIDVPIAVRMRWLLNWKPDLEYGGEGRFENLQSGFVEALSFCCLRIHWSSIVLLKLCRGCVESPPHRNVLSVSSEYHLALIWGWLPWKPGFEYGGKERDLRIYNRAHDASLFGWMAGGLGRQNNWAWPRLLMTSQSTPYIDSSCILVFTHSEELAVRGRENHRPLFCTYKFQIQVKTKRQVVWNLTQIWFAFVTYGMYCGFWYWCEDDNDLAEKEMAVKWSTVARPPSTKQGARIFTLL